MNVYFEQTRPKLTLNYTVTGSFTLEIEIKNISHGIFLTYFRLFFGILRRKTVRVQRRRLCLKGSEEMRVEEFEEREKT